MTTKRAKKSTKQDKGSTKQSIEKAGKIVERSELKVGEMSVATGQIQKAIAALTVFAEKHNPQDQMIFDDNSQSMTVQFNLKKVPKKKFKPVSIKLPHSLWNDKTEACLIVKEPQRKYKDMLDADPRPAVKKVIDVKKWKQRHDAFKDRREICDAFELFLIDDRCAEMIPSLFGKVFTSRNKTPIPVAISKGSKALDKPLASTMMKVSGGITVSVRFGRANFEQEQLLSNCKAVIEAVAQYFQAKGNGITSISMQATGSPTLTVYCAPVTELVVKKSKAEKAMIKSKNKRAKVERKAAKKVKKDGKFSKKQKAPVSDDEAENKVLANTLTQVKVVEPKKEKVSKKGRKSAKTKA